MPTKRPLCAAVLCLVALMAGCYAIARTTDPGTAVESRNLLPNSSFEIAANPSHPDFWGSPGAHDWIPYDEMTLDYQDAYHGKASARITMRPNPRGLRGRGWRVEAEVPHVGDEAWFVLSAYMKTDTPGAGVSFHNSLGTPRYHRFELTGEWQRYKLPFLVRKEDLLEGRHVRSPWYGLESRPTLSVGFHPADAGKEYVFWVDALQLEQGTHATPYTPSRMDRTGGIDRLLSEPRAPPQGEIREYAIAVTGKPPVIDGKLSDECWKTATRAAPFLDWQTGEPVSEHTEAFLARDDEHLYIAFIAHDSDLRNIRKEKTERDSWVWQDDAVEVFLDTNLDRRTHYQFITNALGTRRDACSVHGVMWDAPWEVATREEGDRWITEMAIPFSSLEYGAEVSDTWGINLGREHHRKREYSAWAFTSGKFEHATPRFIRLKNMGMENLRRYGLSCQEIRVDYTDRLNGVCDVLFHLRSRLDRAAEYEIHIDLADASNPQIRKPNAARQTITVRPGDQRIRIRDVRFPIALKHPSRHSSVLKATIRITEPDTGRIVYQRDFGNIRVPPFFDAYVERSHYSVEDNANIVLEVTGAPAGVLKDLRARITLHDNDVSIPAGPLSGNRTLVTLPVAPLKPGTYPFTALLTRNGEEIARVTRTIVKRSPATYETKYDRTRRCLLVGGEPFFMYFMGLHAPHELPHLWKEVADAGFNGVLSSFSRFNVVADNDEILRGLDLAHEHGLKVIIWLMGRQTHKTGDLPKHEIIANHARQILPAVKDHPAVIGYWTADEWWDPEHSRYIYDLCKELDPHRISFHVQCSGYDHWNDVRFEGRSWWEIKDYYTDMIGWDVYPFGQDLPLGSKLRWMVDDAIRTCMHTMGEADRQPLMFWGQALYYGGGQGCYREPTPEEETGHFYQLLINGIRAEAYFFYKPEARELWDRYKQQASELRVLEPVLFSADVEVDIYSENPDVRLLARQYGQDVYLITANILAEPTETRIFLGGLEPRTCEVLFENRTVRPHNSILQDTYLPYERRVYRLTF